MFQLSNLVRKSLLAFILVSGLINNSEAFAVPYQGNNVYKSFDNQGHQIIILSGNSNTQWLIRYLSQDKPTTFYVSACGLIRINNRNNRIRRLSINNTEINISTLPVQAVPKCDREISPFAVNNTSSFVTHDGVIYIANAGSSFMPVQGEVQHLIERRITPNLCGFAVFRAPFNRKDFPKSFEWNGNTYQVDSLLTAPQAPRCIRRNSSITTQIPHDY
ncbi:hypothetical protein NIES4071_106230 (plasmid) [Calothrix sp. NIES-4071]|nr:hypothetical protein NIES4071_106230 [Calothrix sp. NIES-4071]BAZ65041.1 hypothetical protein NIES4105_107740 [Calothrix sp. NIES-4105]